MDIFGDRTLGYGYINRTQQVRLISEGWIAKNGYCLRCDFNKLTPTPTNTRSRDFVCSNCNHGYELKSKRGIFAAKVLDGAYAAMMKTIREGNTPTFLLLEYSTSWSIKRLRAIHHSLITETSIEARRPLAVSAKRAGWIGCNIVLPAIAIEGQISIFHDGKMQSKCSSREAFARLEHLSTLSHSNRSWAGAILSMLHRLPSKSFILADMYRFESELAMLFPNNKHIRPKIRQQLQVLRDAGLINFFGKGRYEIAQGR
jgi:type II restriction enzyme